MTHETLKDLFDRHADAEHLHWERVTNRRSQRPDLHAFLLLDALQPGDGDIVSGAEHDTFYMHTNIEKLADVITEDQVVELLRCGILLDPLGDFLYSFC